ncbi:MAG: cupin domain-containing protein [Bryobacteraceae bacterium]
MTVSRRDLALLLPCLSGAVAEAQQTTNAKKAEAALSVLVSKAYEFDDLPVRRSANGTTTSRPVFNGVTGRGQHLTMHISELAPGEAPHPPARQPHEEVIVIREGTLEVTLNGQTSRLGPGSVIFSAFNDLNGWKNVGTTPAQYYVLSLEEHSA